VSKVVSSDLGHPGTIDPGLASKRPGGTPYAASPEVLGKVRVQAILFCALTRFQLSSMAHLPACYWAFRKARREATRIDGYVAAAFLFESPRVFFSLSLWKDGQAIETFNRLQTHILAARWIMRHVHNRQRRRAEVWSTRWAIDTASQNLHWGDIDWHGLLHTAPAAMRTD
jgi:hypothetical protein